MAEKRDIRALILTGVITGAIFWTYSINTWANYFGSPLQIPWYMGSLMGLYKRSFRVSIPLAIITYATMIILGVQ